jgi:hypothetical protein
MVKKRVKSAVINPLIEKVQRLLQRSREPVVDIRPSKIRNADYGCFTTRPVAKGEVNYVVYLHFILNSAINCHLFFFSQYTTFSNIA